MASPAARARVTARALVLVLVAASCASVRTGDAPRVDGVELLALPPLPATSYELNPGLNAVVEASPKQCVAPLFLRAFRAHALEDGAAPDVHLELELHDRPRHPPATGVLYLGFLLTAGVVPAYGRADVTLEARVRFRGELTGRYVYAEQVDTWIHWLALPWARSRRPRDVHRAAIDDLVLRLLADLRRDWPELTRAR